MSGAEELTTPVDVDVVVIGAGLSGLTAADHLLQRGVTSLRVIEAKDRVGGRTFSKELRTAHGKQRWDIGGQWIGTLQQNIIKLVDELDMETYPQFKDGKKILSFPDGRVKIYEGDTPPVSLVLLIQYKLAIDKFEAFSKTVPTENPGRCAGAQQWDSMTFESFIQQRGVFLGCKDLREMLRNMIRSIWGLEASEVSFLSFLLILASAGGFLPIIESNEQSAQGLKVKGTAHGISLKLTERVGTDNVILGDPVVSINQKSGAGCLVETKKGRLLNSKFVIVAIPPHQRSYVDFCEPNLPSGHHHLQQHYISAHMMKYIFTYETPFWREQKFSGEMFSGAPPMAFHDPHATAQKASKPRPSSTQPTSSMDKTFDEGAAVEQTALSLHGDPILFMYDASIDNGDLLHLALVVFVQPKTAVLRSTIGDGELKKRVLDQLVGYFGQAAASPIDFALGDWYGFDSASNNISPGGLVNYGELRRQPFCRVHWAGTEAATEWIGYMDGAVQAGHLAAEEVLEKLSVDKQPRNL